MDLSTFSDAELLTLRKRPLAQVPDAELLAMRQPQQFTADQPSNLEALTIGAGRGISNLGEGLQQMYYAATGNDAKSAELKAGQQESARLYAPLQKSHPWMTGIGESFPEMAAGLMTGGAATIPAAMAKQGLAAAIPAALSYGSPEERGVRALKAGAQTAVGTGALGVVGKAITPTTAGALAPNADVLGAAERIGYKLTPGQKLDSTPLMRLEQGLAQRTGSAPIFEQLRAGNAAAVNKAAAADLGETLNPVRNQITTDVLHEGRQRINDQFKKMIGKTDVTLGPNFLNDLAAVDVASRQGLPSLRKAGGGNLIDEVIDDALALAAKGKMSGDAYQNTRSVLARKTTEAYRGNNSDLGRALDGLVTALDDAAGQSMTGAEQAAWKLARKQWSVLKTLETGNVVQAGNVNPLLVKGQMQKNYGIPYKEGTMQGPMVDIARVGEGIKPLRDSGTPAGLEGMNMTTPGGLFQTLANTPFRYLLAKSYLSGPGQGYITNQALGPEAKRRLMQGGGLLGAGYPEFP